MSDAVSRVEVATAETPVVAPPKPQRKGFHLPDPSRRGIVETFLIVSGVLASFVLLRHGLYADGELRYHSIDQLLRYGVLTNSKYSMIGPFFSIPLWVAGAAIGQQAALTATYNVFVFTFGLFAFYWLLKDAIGHIMARQFLLILLVASMFPSHLHWYYGEVFTAICVGVGTLALVLNPSIWAWALIVVGVANTPATLVALGCVCVVHVWYTRRLRAFLAVAAAAGLIMAESWIRRGGPFNSRYESGFNYPFVFGVLSILFSFGNGIFFFAPGLLAPIRARLAQMGERGRGSLWHVYMLWLAFIVGMVLIYANWYDWSGSWFWGPRFFLFASIPASFALAIRLRWREASLGANLLTAALLLFACYVGLNGAIFGTTTLNNGFHGYTCPHTGSWRDNICYYSPELSVLFQPFIVAYETHWSSSAFISAENLGHSELLFAAYSLAVFAYLLAPLLLRIVRQSAALVGPLWQVVRTEFAL